MQDLLRDIIARRSLSAIFQPIISMRTGAITGYEGLIRGPSNSPLHAPANLFAVARRTGQSSALERLCREVILTTFSRRKLPGKLFLNVSPECLMQAEFERSETAQLLEKIGLRPSQVIIELTESQPTYEYEVLKKATQHYRQMGFEIAIDDLGEGFAGLRLWSELRPDYVKIDRHFIQNINQDSVKLQFVRSIQQIAENSQCQVIAEGIETAAELMIIKDLGIEYGQGYHIARPGHIPTVSIAPDVVDALLRSGITVYPHAPGTRHNRILVSRLLKSAPAVSPDTPSETVYRIFADAPELHAIPVVQDSIPVGLINRYSLIDSFSRLYSRELYGKKSCARYMNAAPLVVDRNMTLQDLSHIIVASDKRYLSDGFIITDGGAYAGLGTGHDLMREIAQMQIDAARYANPLTMLPGNVPLNEHIDRLLANHAAFVACYCDLDHFKPLNDRYGYRKGDEIIQLTGRILSDICDPERDFVGHIGGDDFLILFQSEDWTDRCHTALEQFGTIVTRFFATDDIARGGYHTEDRRGQQVFHPLTSMSIGAVKIEPGLFQSHHEISALSADAKKQAKRIQGNSLFVERRAFGRTGESQSPGPATAVISAAPAAL